VLDLSVRLYILILVSGVHLLILNQLSYERYPLLSGQCGNFKRLTSVRSELDATICQSISRKPFVMSSNLHVGYICVPQDVLCGVMSMYYRNSQ